MKKYKRSPQQRMPVPFQPEQGDEMKSNQANLAVKVEWKEAEIPELGRIYMVPNQGTIEGGRRMQHDTKPVPLEQSGSNQMVRQTGPMQNLRAFLQQSSQNRVKPEPFVFHPPSAAGQNSRAMNMRPMGWGNHGMLQKYWPLLPPPPSFISTAQNLKQFSMANQPSDFSWPMPPSTQLSMGPPNPATNYPLRGSSNTSVNSSNRHPIPPLRENDIMRYLMNRDKMAARPPAGNEFLSMMNPHHSAGFNYQLQAGISGGQESCYSHTFYPLPPERPPLVLANVVTTEGGETSSCYPRQYTPRTTCIPPPTPVSYNQHGPIQQFTGLRTELRERPKEKQGKKVKHIPKQEETHHYPPKFVMDQNARDFLEALGNFSGSSRHTSSSSSRPNRRRGNNNNNPPLYSIRSKASDFHVDPILRAFAISMKKKGKNNRNARNSKNISK